MENKHVLIIDDHPVLRRGVSNVLLNEFPDMKIGFASDSVEALASLENTRWDLIILDINLPGLDGFEILKKFKDEGVQIPVLIFSFYREEHIAVKAFKAGAFGYLYKGAGDAELIVAVNSILSGKKYISSYVSEQLIKNLESPSEKLPHELLSEREYQTLLFIATGKTVTEIADELSLSRPTISTYRTRILKKMRLENNAQLANYAIRKNLV